MDSCAMHSKPCAWLGVPDLQRAYWRNFMHATIFHSRILAPFLHRCARRLLALRGWQVVCDLAIPDRYVIICAPHTSNWDFPIAMLMFFTLRLKVYWMGKKSLFRWPFGGIARWLGGLAVDREKGANMVQATINAFESHSALGVAIAPEGTRAKVTHWKTGFYRIAVGAGVPIVMAFLDYKKKTGGVGMVFYPTGDIEADMQVISDFYRGCSGKNSKAFDSGDIRIKPD